MTNKKTSVIIFHQDDDISEMLVDIIRPFFEKVIHENIATKAIEDFHCLKTSHSQAIILYAFHSVLESKQLRSDLLNHDHFNLLEDISYKSILLCDKLFRDEAFEACLNNTYDAYDTINPLYDSKKLVLDLRLTPLRANYRPVDQHRGAHHPLENAQELPYLPADHLDHWVSCPEPVAIALSTLPVLAVVSATQQV